MTILQAVEQGNAAMLKELLFDQDARAAMTHDGASLVWIAAEQGNLEVLRLLVEESHFVTLSQPDDRGRNTLHFAVMSGDMETVIYCVERLGFDALASDYEGMTPFEYAHNKSMKSIETYFELRVGATFEQMYHNPIRHGFYADPSIVRHGDDYYMVNSSFVYFPAIPISHSKDLINWKIIGYAITDESWAELGTRQCGHGYWAPDISYHDGKFWICATLRGNGPEPLRRQMITWSNQPQGPYHKPKFIDVNGIDPSIFCDTDGKRYMLVNPGARIFQINEDGEQVSEPQLLYFGDMKHKAEAPHMLKKNGWYYLFLAEGGTGEGHRVTVSRSKELFGIYQPCPHNPILHQDNVRAYLTRSGHAKLVQTSDDEWYGVYLCTRRTQGYSIQGRETGLDPVTWNADGWPMFNELKGPSVLQKRPNLSVHAWQEPADVMDNDDVQNGWMSVRQDAARFAAFSEGQLTIKGGNPLFQRDGVSALLRRQSESKLEYQAKIAKIDECIEAGIVGYYDENSYFTFGVAHSGSGAYLLTITEGVKGNPRVLWTGKVDRLPITLKVAADGLSRQCWYGADDDEFQMAFQLDHVTYLADEGLKGQRFTGTMQGIYAVNQRGLGEAIISDYRIKK